MAKKKLLDDMVQSMQKFIVIYCDNISNIMLVNNPLYHAKTNHIEVDCEREKVLEGDIDLVYVSTEEQVVDIFTKAFCIEKLHKSRGFLGVLALDLSLRGSVKISSSTTYVTSG